MFPREHSCEMFHGNILTIKIMGCKSLIPDCAIFLG
jgi:hypothetical protein